MSWVNSGHVYTMGCKGETEKKKNSQQRNDTTTGMSKNLDWRWSVHPPLFLACNSDVTFWSGTAGQS